MRKWIALTVLALVGACGTDNAPPVAPDPPAAPPPAAALEAPAAPAEATSSAGSAKVWAHGAVDVTGPWDGFVCYFWRGPHEQDKAAPDVVVDVPAGKTARFNLPSVKPSKPERCELQIDVAKSCAKSSIMPGLIADGYVQIRPCPNPTPTPSPTPSPTPTPPVCVEGGPYEGRTTWSGAILKGPCPETFGTSCEEKCHELGERKTTWDCQGPTTEPVCRPAECPDEPKGCHVSNQGGPGDTNFNIVLTNSRPHLIHSQRAGFCPGDLFRECSCEAARAAAEKCGDPARGGFVCKDNR